MVLPETQKRPVEHAVPDGLSTGGYMRKACHTIGKHEEPGVCAVPR